MKPEALHREHLTALLKGDLEGAARLRKQFGPRDHVGSAEFLRAAVAVCVEFRFGPGAGLGAGPVDFERLAAFMTELRRAGRGVEPPPDYLAVEAVIRSLYGEPHLIEPLGEQQRSQAHFTALEFELRRHAWLKANPEHLVERARQRMTAWLLT